MPRVMANIRSGCWSVHFIGPDGLTRVGPWLLFQSHEEIKTKVLSWGGITPEDLVEHESSISRWGSSSIFLELTPAKFRKLIERGIGWPWNGYELEQMRKAGKYPPKRLTSQTKR
jgi:hypothetical protein